MVLHAQSTDQLNGCEATDEQEEKKCGVCDLEWEEQWSTRNVKHFQVVSLVVPRMYLTVTVHEGKVFVTV